MTRFLALKSEQAAPAQRHYTITPGSSDLNPRPRALYVNGDGNATISDGTTSIEYTGLTAGMVLPIEAVKVTAATATLVAWY